MNRKALPLLAASLLFVLLGCVSTPSEKNIWAVGEWRFKQTFTDPKDRPNVLTGKLQIERGKRGFTGRIYLDVREEWEILDEVQVTGTTVQFSRALYNQEFGGRRTETGMKGTWETNSGRSLAGKWEAERN